MSDVADADLVNRVIARDETAFRLLYRRHTPAMYGAAMRLVGFRRDAADDAVQEAWLRAVRDLRRFRWESALRTWLLGITVRCALELTRKAPPAVAGNHIEPAIDASPPPVDLDSALAALPDGYRQVLVLHDVEGYTHAEIAELLHIDEGTSKSQLSRARAALRTWFARTPEEYSHES
jgi:RNA polymerase sigma-70 factor (ECF subfamily)